MFEDSEWRKLKRLLGKLPHDFRLKKRANSDEITLEFPCLCRDMMKCCHEYTPLDALYFLRSGKRIRYGVLSCNEGYQRRQIAKHLGLTAKTIQTVERLSLCECPTGDCDCDLPEGISQTERRKLRSRIISVLKHRRG